jgi:hypothetical protein
MAAVFAPPICAAGILACALILRELCDSVDKIVAALNFEPIPGSARHGR